MNQKDAAGVSPLQMALDRRDENAADFLLRHGARCENVFEASAAGDCSWLTLSLDRDRELVNARGKSGETPLHQAARYGRVDAAALLLSYGAELNATDKSGETPYIWAFKAGRFTTLNFLKEKGASTEFPGEAGREPVPEAASDKAGMEMKPLKTRAR